LKELEQWFLTMNPRSSGFMSIREEHVQGGMSYAQ